jgi:polyferredoxin
LSYDRLKRGKMVKSFTLRQRSVFLPLFIACLISLVVWLVEYDFLPLVIVTMLLLSFFEDIWNRRKLKATQKEKVSIEADYRGYVVAVILNIILILLISQRSLFSSIQVFLVFLFGFIVGTVNVSLIAGLIVDGFFYRNMRQIHH